MFCDSDSAQARSIIERHYFMFCSEFSGYDSKIFWSTLCVNAHVNALISDRNCGLKLVRGAPALRGRRIRV